MSGATKRSGSGRVPRNLARSSTWFPESDPPACWEKPALAHGLLWQANIRRS